MRSSAARNCSRETMFMPKMHTPPSPARRRVASQSGSSVPTKQGMRVAALWTINDGADVLFNLTTQNDTTKGDWHSDPYLGDSKITRFIEDSRHDNWWQAAATVTADVGFAEFKSATAYFARHMTYTEDNMVYG